MNGPASSHRSESTVGLAHSAMRACYASIRWGIGISLLLITAVVGIDRTAIAADVQPRTVMRLFWYDRADSNLKYGDLTVSDRWVMRRGKIAGVPQLQSELQDMGDLAVADVYVLASVRDNQDGGQQSGWIVIDSGVREEPHGNHTHWKYAAPPSLKFQRIDNHQGNPARIHVADGVVYAVQDSRNGFYTLPTGSLSMNDPWSQAAFRVGGGNGSEPVGVSGSVCYCTWGDADGDDGGRVDVVSLTRPGTTQPAYSFRLPSGNIKAATVNSGRVFFAPDDGICHVAVDPNGTSTSDAIRVQHISIGTDAATGQPERTNGFANQRNWVMFSTQSTSGAALCLMDAAAAGGPSIVKLPVAVNDELILLPPDVVLATGRRYAFLFQDRTEDGTAAEQLSIVDLDPNNDRNFSDATIRVTIPTGSSRVDGKGGAHSVCFDAYGRFAAYANPADGTISIVSLADLQTKVTFNVGGIPTNLQAVGAPEHFH